MAFKHKQQMLALTEIGAFTLVLTVFTKKIAGRLRPNFTDMCGWNGYECMNSVHRAMSARQSFPSRHA